MKQFSSLTKAVHGTARNTSASVTQPPCDLYSGSCPKVVILVQLHLLQRSGPKQDGWQAQLGEAIVVPCQYNFTVASLRVARLGWLPSQAKLPPFFFHAHTFLGQSARANHQIEICISSGCQLGQTFRNPKTTKHPGSHGFSAMIVGDLQTPLTQMMLISYNLAWSEVPE